MTPLTDELASLLVELRNGLLGISAESHRWTTTPSLGSVGAHVRHILDHVETILRSDGAIVDYDDRRRDTLDERDPVEAVRRLDAVLDDLPRLDGAPPEASLVMRVSIGHTGRGQPRAVQVVDTTVGRELAFLVSHTVHHMAMIRSLLLQRGFELPSEFGVASATTRARAQVRATEQEEEDRSCAR